MKLAKFKPVTGAMIMAEIEKYDCESDIEYAFKYFLKYISENRFIITKQGFEGTKSRTDGRILFKIKDNVFIEGLQEAKFTAPKTKLELKKRLAQALHYNYFNYTKNFTEYSFFFFPTSTGVAYVLRKNIEELINTLHSHFEKTTTSPSTNWKDLSIRNIMKNNEIEFNEEKITENFKLNIYFEKILKNI